MYNLRHGTDAHHALSGALQKGFPKNTYLTLSERLGFVFMKTYEGERNMNTKKINMEMITCVCACTLYMHECAGLESWGSVLWLERGHRDYYRGAVFLSLKNPV